MNSYPKKEDWMTAKEVRQMLKLSPRTVAYYTASGIFKKYKVGRHTYRYLKSEIMKSMGVKSDEINNMNPVFNIKKEVTYE